MNVGESPSWQVRIYRMGDVRTQAEAADLLEKAGLRVDARTCERGSFVIVDCAKPTDAPLAHDLVTQVDQDAELIHSTTGPHRESVPL